jgi:hypothetical protein
VYGLGADGSCQGDLAVVADATAFEGTRGL